jgi:hypothetical protein
LFKQFFQHIYLNYRIWISTEVAVQKLLLQSISSHIHRNPKVSQQVPHPCDVKQVIMISL